MSKDDSPKISSSSYTTTLSSNKMFYIPNDSCQILSKEDDSSKSSKNNAETSIKKSKSFSFERNFNERKSLEVEKKRNLSYFSHHSCKLQFNLEMDFLKKFSITNENQLTNEKIGKFRGNRDSKKSRRNFKNDKEFVIGRTYEFGIMKKDNFKEQENQTQSLRNISRNFSFQNRMKLSQRNKSPRLSHTRNSRKNKPKILLTTSISKEKSSNQMNGQIKKCLSECDYDSMKKSYRSRANSINTLANSILTYKVFVNKREKHITYKLGAILFTFMISWTPFCLLWPIVSVCPKCVPQNVYLFSFWLAYLNSIFTPVILLYNNSKYRRSLTFLKILFIKIFWCFHKNENLNFHNSSYYVTHKLESNSRNNNLNRNVYTDLPSISQKRTSFF